jgi:Ca2+-binding RTX toxin-like protein
LLGGAGPDILDGGAGDDFASYGDLISGITINLGAPGSSSGDAQGDSYNNMEGVIGTGGDDTIHGASGFTTLRGGAGDDTFFASAQAERMDGEADSNTVNYSASTSAVTVDLSDANPEAGGFAAGDTLVNIDKIIGSSFNDSLKAGAAAMTLESGGGQDTLQGGAGNDTLDLKTGNTALNDVAKGGAGSDTFIVEHSKISAGTGLIDGESGGVNDIDTLQLHMASNGTLDFANFSSKDSLFTGIEKLDMSKDGFKTTLTLTKAGIQALVTDGNNSADLTIVLSAGNDKVSIGGVLVSGGNTTYDLGSGVTATLQWV